MSYTINEAKRCLTTEKNLTLKALWNNISTSQSEQTLAICVWRQSPAEHLLVSPFVLFLLFKHKETSTLSYLNSNLVSNLTIAKCKNSSITFDMEIPKLNIWPQRYSWYLGVFGVPHWRERMSDERYLVSPANQSSSCSHATETNTTDSVEPAPSRRLLLRYITVICAISVKI